MQALTYSYYELKLVCLGSVKLASLPKAAQVLASLPANSFCSDLLVDGFTHKAVDLCADQVALEDSVYRLLKRLRGADYIADCALGLSTRELLEALEDGTLRIREGYIGADETLAHALQRAVLPEDPGVFGLELCRGGKFRLFLKTAATDLPQKLTIAGCDFSVDSVLPRGGGENREFVLQQDLPLAENYRLSPDSRSRFRLGYDKETKQKYLCAGSVICPGDDFGQI